MSSGCWDHYWSQIIPLQFSTNHIDTHTSINWCTFPVFHGCVSENASVNERSLVLFVLCHSSSHPHFRLIWALMWLIQGKYDSNSDQIDVNNMKTKRDQFSYLSKYKWSFFRCWRLVACMHCNYELLVKIEDSVQGSGGRIKKENNFFSNNHKFSWVS